jgi:hypothetical protein
MVSVIVSAVFAALPALSFVCVWLLMGRPSGSQIISIGELWKLVLTAIIVIQYGNTKLERISKVRQQKKPFDQGFPGKALVYKGL